MDLDFFSNFTLFCAERPAGGHLQPVPPVKEDGQSTSLKAVDEGGGFRVQAGRPEGEPLSAGSRGGGKPAPAPEQPLPLNLSPQIKVSGSKIKVVLFQVSN